MRNLVCDVRLGSWVEPMLRDLSMLKEVGFIREETLEEIVPLLLRDGIVMGPVRDMED